MLHFYDRAGFGRALTLDLDTALYSLLAERIGGLTDDLLDYTEFLVVENDDTEEDIIRHIGISPMIEPMDGARFGEPGFRPHWDYLAAHDGWFEFVFTFGSTFAYVLFIQSGGGEADPLQRLCRSYSSVSEV
jgi:hypothetical protein